MKRLVRNQDKFWGKDNYKGNKYIIGSDGVTSKQMVIDKLGKLEDLEEQIGCPLDVFFKLVKQVKINFNGTMTGYFVFYNLLHKRFEIRNEETMDLFPLTDYKKKFWLKEDKSE
jgi:hypothetical protein